jgi:uncharacterized protein (TIGR03435 family)
LTLAEIIHQMPDAQDMELVREFARDHSEAAFTELVRRHINLVYSVARRCTGNDGDAHDVTQAVFIILARKAARLREKTLLTGWLYETTRFAAARLLRTNARRHAREQEAYMQSTLNEADNSAIWEKLSPHLENAMGKLNAADRALLVLRFYENKSGTEAAALLGIREDAAHKRVTRAIEKLRKFFVKRGVTLSGAAIAGAVSANSVQAAPVALVKTISAVAVAKGAAASTSTLTLIKGALKIMAWTKMKTVIVASTVVLLAAGTTTVAVKEIQEHKTYLWQIGNFDERVLNEQPPQVRLLPSKLKGVGSGTAWDKNNHFTSKMMGLDVSAEQVIEAAYRFYNPSRTVILTELPKGQYDYIACFTFPVGVIDGNEKALQQLIKKKFGVIAKVETRDTDALLLEVQNANAPNLKQFAVPSGEETFQGGRGAWSGKNVSIANFTTYLEQDLGTPLFDQTKLTNRFDFSLKWSPKDWQHPNLDGLKQALLDQLGLELVPTNMPIEMLVVEKVK